jgi:SAM-dependent methyltransferase
MTDGVRLAPSDWVLGGLSGLPSGAHVLDVACGSGRHARAALDAGLRVTAIDRASLGTSDLVGRAAFRFVEADLEDGALFPLQAGRFDAIVVTNYLHRPILPVLAGMAARDGGRFIYETFATGQERLGRPTNPDFLLQPNELLVVALAAGLIVRAFEFAEVSTETRRVVQRIIADAPAET